MTDLRNAGRIGIFQYDWSLYAFIKEFVIKLAEAGYLVDVFQKDPDIKLDFANAEHFKQYNNIRYLKFVTPNTMRRKIMRRMARVLSRFSSRYARSPKRFIDSDILRQSIILIREAKYQCLIGIEKKGLLWAGVLSQMFKYPLLYYSLELYIEDHPRLASAMASDGYLYLRQHEKRYHKLCNATIIQHELRARALQHFNEIGPSKWIYLPISVRGNIIEGKSTLFHRKYHIPGDKKLLLYFGLIQDERYSTALVRIANRLKDDIMLIMHGYGDKTYLTKIQEIASENRVIFSCDMVEEGRIIEVISSATIGLALYENTNSNDRLAAFSSVKVAYYMQCGVPVIAFNSESFVELMNSYKCGELINSIEEIPEKVEIILKDYSSYRKQAFMAFRQFYDFDRNFGSFMRAFMDCMKNELNANDAN
ncbi:MAG: glycosyltransferase [Acidobacteria bacterium]|nr:glycosyltransferase [Acidobacteriota bacterium]